MEGRVRAREWQGTGVSRRWQAGCLQPCDALLNARQEAHRAELYRTGPAGRMWERGEGMQGGVPRYEVESSVSPRWLLLEAVAVRRGVERKTAAREKFSCDEELSGDLARGRNEEQMCRADAVVTDGEDRRVRKRVMLFVTSSLYYCMLANMSMSYVSFS